MREKTRGQSDRKAVEWIDGRATRKRVPRLAAFEHRLADLPAQLGYASVGNAMLLEDDADAAAVQRIGDGIIPRPPADVQQQMDDRIELCVSEIGRDRIEEIAVERVRLVRLRAAGREDGLRIERPTALRYGPRGVQSVKEV